MINKRAMAAQALMKSGFWRLLQRLIAQRGLLVLNYHRVRDDETSVFDYGLWSATSGSFAEQLRFCKANADVIGPGDLSDILARPDDRSRYVLITFDDGYRDNYEVAFPILRDLGVPALFFVATGFIGTGKLPWWDEIARLACHAGTKQVTLPKWWDVGIPKGESTADTLLRKYKSLPSNDAERFLLAVADEVNAKSFGSPCPDLWMTWDMLREMQRKGMSIGAHTVTHPILSRATMARQQYEVETSCQHIIQEIGVQPSHFSYPVGGTGAFTMETMQCVKRAGFRFAYSHYSGMSRFCEWQDLNIKRVPIETYITRDVFRSVVVAPNWFARERMAMSTSEVTSLTGSAKEVVETVA
jgi:peptidoglycan/xylan/chitin deacetylase (PgdA/CDA1 family)